MLVMEKPGTRGAKLDTVDLTPIIGVEIRSDIETLLGGAAASQIRTLLEERGVIVFRELNLTDQQQVAFTATLGSVAMEGADGIYKVTMDKKENAQAEYLKGAFYWHIDGTMSDVPILASLLSGRRLSDTGGETEFANTYAAYDALPEDEKAAIDQLQVVHSLETAQLYVNPEPSYADLQTWQRMGANTLPLVWKHSSGRKSLILGATASHVVGMEPMEGRALLVRLREWATQPRFVYQHKWTVGDLVIWDNTGTMHRAMAYALDSGRMMHRTKLEGEESFA